MAVSVGARRPVADVKAIFTSSCVPTFSPMRRMTLDSLSAMTPSDRRWCEGSERLNRSYTW
eukprot:5878621-Pleurochrysis_carterae.AAC.1